MLLVTGARINQALAGANTYAAVRFAIFVAVLMANFFESNFACMTPLGFLFLVAAIGEVQPAPAPWRIASDPPESAADHAAFASAKPAHAAVLY
jgi:hypothetical protein